MLAIFDSSFVPFPIYIFFLRSLCLTGETHNLQSLHTILSTGSPLKPQSYDYVYRCIKSNVLLGSISGDYLMSGHMLSLFSKGAHSSSFSKCCWCLPH